MIKSSLLKPLLGSTTTLLTAICALLLCTLSSPAKAQAEIINISTNGFVGEFGLKAGFIISGTVPQRVVVFAEAFNSDINSIIRVTDITGNTLFDQNDNWQDHPTADEVLATTRAPGRSTDAALAVTLQPGVYLASMNSTNGRSGAGLVSINSLSDTVSRLINISTNGFVDGNNQMAAGFIVSGNTPKRLLIAAERFQSNVDATLAVTDLSGNTTFASNDDWLNNITFPEVISLIGRGLGSGLDSGLVVTLQPGVYLANMGTISGVGNGIVSINDLYPEFEFMQVNNTPRIQTPQFDLEDSTWRWYRRPYFTNVTSDPIEIVAYSNATACTQGPEQCSRNIFTDPQGWTSFVNGIWSSCAVNGRLIIAGGQTCISDSTFNVFSGNATIADNTEEYFAWVSFAGSAPVLATSLSYLLDSCSTQPGSVNIQIGGPDNSTAGYFNNAEGQWEWPLGDFIVENNSSQPITILRWDNSTTFPEFFRHSGDLFAQQFDGCGAGNSTIQPGSRACFDPQGYFFSTENGNATDTRYAFLYQNPDGSQCGVFTTWSRQQATEVRTISRTSSSAPAIVVNPQAQCSTTECRRGM